jgi:hypothetical protein
LQLSYIVHTLLLSHRISTKLAPFRRSLPLTWLGRATQIRAKSDKYYRNNHLHFIAIR